MSSKSFAEEEKKAFGQHFTTAFEGGGHDINEGAGSISDSSRRWLLKDTTKTSSSALPPLNIDICRQCIRELTCINQVLAPGDDEQQAGANKVEPDPRRPPFPSTSYHDKIDVNFPITEQEGEEHTISPFSQQKRPSTVRIEENNKPSACGTTRSSTTTRRTPSLTTRPPPGGENKKNLLPSGFTPGNWSIIVGQNKQSIHSIGNKRLHIMIGWYSNRYADARNDKDEKIRIISEIESNIRNACAEEGVKGAFIKMKEDGTGWYEVSRLFAREKIGRLLREALHSKYRSSSKQKRARQRRSSLK